MSLARTSVAFTLTAAFLSVGCQSLTAKALSRQETESQQDRVEHLIESLDKVSPTAWSNPGGPWYGGDPILEALKKEGTAAIEPLIDAFEHDKRYTKAVVQDGHFAVSHRAIQNQPVQYISVRTVAWVALANTERFEALTPGGTRPSPVEVRAYWNTIKGLSLPEIWLKTLQTDCPDSSAPQSFGVEQSWYSAASHITDPEGSYRVGFASQMPKPVPGKTLPMRGESLRSKKNPSVTDLIAKRAIELANSTSNNTGRFFEYAEGQDMALLLAKWDARAALPVLQKVSRAVMGPNPFPGFGDAYYNNFAKNLGRVISERLRLGDKTAAREYSQWLETRTVARISFDADLKIFEPLVEYPTNPDFAKAAKFLFASPTSGWNPELMIAKDQAWHADRLLELKPYQQSVLAALKNQTVIGQTTVTGSQIRIGQIGTALRPEELQAENPPAKTDLRVCDVAAYNLAKLEDAPAYKPYWSTEKRDMAISQITAYLKTNSTKIADLIPWPNNWKQSPDFDKLRRKSQKSKST